MVVNVMNFDKERDTREVGNEDSSEREDSTLETGEPRPDDLPEPGEDIPGQWLAVRLGHMGDVVLTTGVLLYLGERFDWRFQRAPLC